MGARAKVAFLGMGPPRNISLCDDCFSASSLLLIITAQSLSNLEFGWQRFPFLLKIKKNYLSYHGPNFVARYQTWISNFSPLWYTKQCQA